MYALSLKGQGVLSKMNLQAPIKAAGAEQVTPLQSRMARAALKLGIRDLAALANVAVSTVSRFEAGLKVHGRTVDDMRKALEGKGIVFIGDHGAELSPDKPRGRRK
jgi:DNA-binding transcriptional regulator YiaG